MQSGLPVSAEQVLAVSDRADVGALLAARAGVDVIVPRGGGSGSSLVVSVSRHMPCGGAVAPNGGIDVEIRARPAAGPPALAVEGMGAVAAEEPAVMEREHHRERPAEVRERAEVEIAPMKVVALDDVRGNGR